MIRAANALDAARVLILAPAVARGSWKLQLAEWDDRARPVLTFPRHNRAAADRFTIPASGPLAMIVGLEWLSLRSNTAKLLDAMAAADPFDVAFVDEAHALKSPKAARTQAVYGRALDLKGAVLGNEKYRWLATATLTPLGHVGELHPHLRAIFPDVLASMFGGGVPNRIAFEDRFCRVFETRFGREIIGNNDETVGQLRDALLPFILMRRKTDVLAELPPNLTIPLSRLADRPNALGDDAERAPACRPVRNPVYATSEADRHSWMPSLVAGASGTMYLRWPGHGASRPDIALRRGLRPDQSGGRAPRTERRRAGQTGPSGPGECPARGYRRTGKSRLRRFRPEIGRHGCARPLGALSTASGSCPAAPHEHRDAAIEGRVRGNSRKWFPRASASGSDHSARVPQPVLQVGCNRFGARDRQPDVGIRRADSVGMTDEVQAEALHRNRF